MLINFYSLIPVRPCSSSSSLSRDILTLGKLVETNCKHCRVRWLQQQKYLKEAYELYGEVRVPVFFQYEYIPDDVRFAQDFHIVKMPLLSEEVRGVESLKKFVDRSFIKSN